MRAYQQHQSGHIRIFYNSTIPEPSALAIASMLAGCGMIERRAMTDLLKGLNVASAYGRLHRQ